MMPLTCFLDIVGCVPDKMSSKYSSLLPFLKTLFTTSTKEDIRDTASLIYAIITVHTSDKTAIDKEINEFVVQGQGNKDLESQCGYLSAFAHMCERCIMLARRGKFGGKGFNAANWEPYQQGVLCLGKYISNLSYRNRCHNKHKIYLINQPYSLLNKNLRSVKEIERK